jgi:nucleotide-binding universal stress UspA family protein
MIPVEGTVPRVGRRPGQSTILAAVDQTPVARLVTEAAARLALAEGQVVYVVHARESATAGDVAVDAEDLDAARDLVRMHLDQLAAHRVPAEGQVLLHAADHGGAGRLIAEYATTIGATTIVLGAPTHGGLSALMDASASQELMRHTSSNVLIVNPAAPMASVSANGSAAVAMAQRSGPGSETA